MRSGWLMLALAACSYPHPGVGGDGSVDDAERNDGGGDATDGPTPTATAIRVPFGGATFQEQAHSVAVDADGNFYVAGYAADLDVTPPVRRVMVAKLTSAGELDLAYGVDGIATTPLAYTGVSAEIQIAIQQGKAVVAATIAAVSDPADNDIAITRLSANGEVDPMFNGKGLLTRSWNTASGSPPITSRDAVRAIGVDATNRIYVAGVTRNNVGTDLDLVVMRVRPDGEFDATYAGGADFFSLDFGAMTSETVRSAFDVMPDGSVFVGGYSPAGGGTQPFMVKVTAAGVLDVSFASTGVISTAVFPAGGAAECYGFAIHATSIVCAGYGRAMPADLIAAIAMKLDRSTGGFDTAFSGTANLARVYPAATLTRARDALALAGGRSLMVGLVETGTGPSDAMWAVIEPDGQLDGMLNRVTLAADRLNVFWSAAASSSKLMMVGTAGAGMTQSPALNDDSYAYLISPIP